MVRIENKAQYRWALQRVEELLSGKKEPTLLQARAISRKLDIDPAVVLGV